MKLDKLYDIIKGETPGAVQGAVWGPSNFIKGEMVPWTTDQRSL